MSSVVIYGDTSGAITLAANAVAGTNTLTLPSNTGTLLSNASTFSGTGPAFSVYLSTNQTIATSTPVKVQFNTKVFDTASAFDIVTNYRFTPAVAGYYQFNLKLQIGASPSDFFGSIIKNGSAEVYRTTRGGINSVTGSTLIYLNGSTDYVEAYVYSNVSPLNGSAITVGDNCYFSGSMVRSA